MLTHKRWSRACNYGLFFLMWQQYTLPKKLSLCIFSMFFSPPWFVNSSYLLQEPISTMHTNLTLPAVGNKNCFRVRSKLHKYCASGSFWSEWSPQTCTIFEQNTTSKQTTHSSKMCPIIITPPCTYTTFFSISFQVAPNFDPFLRVSSTWLTVSHMDPCGALLLSTTDWLQPFVHVVVHRILVNHWRLQHVKWISIHFNGGKIILNEYSNIFILCNVWMLSHMTGENYNLI